MRGRARRLTRKEEGRGDGMMPELLLGRNAPRPKRGRKDAGQRPETADLKVNVCRPVQSDDKNAAVATRATARHLNGHK